MSDWSQLEQALNEIEVIGFEDNRPVTINGFPEELRCIGIGTDAAVFYSRLTPAYAYKVYSDKAKAKIRTEMEIYRRLEGAPYFPKCYGRGPHYLVIRFEPGITLYDCLLEGIPVPEQVIQDVEDARAFVRKQGLNPRDIHLKNVLMHEGRGKVLDVSEYAKEGSDNRWEHLLWAYRHLYPLIAGKPVPLWMLETITHWYHRVDQASFQIEDFAQKISRLFDWDRE